MDELLRVIGPPAAHVVESDLGGTIGLYNPESEEVLVLNETASDVWRLSDGTQTLDTMVALLAQAYQVSAAEIRDEVAETVQTFWDRGLLMRAAA